MTIGSGHVDRQLAEYCDGRLAPQEAARTQKHLATCPRCQEALDEFTFAADLMQRLPVVSAPASIWEQIGKGHVEEPPTRFRGLAWVRLPTAAAVALLVLAFAGASYWYRTPGPEEEWQVTRQPAAGSYQRVTSGESFETDASGQLRFNVGQIGTVDVAPNSRVRILSTRASEHRLALERGAISAVIMAPPRLFFVNTPSSTVVDLGCAYTMHVDDNGAGRLQVTLGWSSLEWEGRESLVPAGATCLTRPQVGPGTPYFDDASPAMQAALNRWDFENGGTQALEEVLGEARPRDTLTLWHLLSRVDQEARAQVFDRIVALTPLPRGVSRAEALALDRDTLERWRQELAWTW